MGIACHTKRPCSSAHNSMISSEQHPILFLLYEPKLLPSQEHFFGSRFPFGCPQSNCLVGFFGHRCQHRWGFAFDEIHLIQCKQEFNVHVREWKQ